MKLSICCCGINCKYDFDLFASFMYQHNKDVDFEIVFTHDDRVNDGSSEYYTELQKRVPNIKIVKNTHEDTVFYLRKLMDYYDQTGKFSDGLRKDLRANVEKFSNRELFDHRKSFLWLTSGILYNKAVQASSGDLLIVTPADFIYGFKLRDLVDFVKTRMQNGLFYTKPYAIWGRLTNQALPWLQQHVQNVHNGIGYREGYRYDSVELFKDYLKAPSSLDDMYLPDFRNNRIIRFSDPTAIDQMYIFNEQSVNHGGVQFIPDFHGFHFMTRAAYDKIGGFTECYYGRAFPDDVMTYLGKRVVPTSPVPPQFSVYWAGQYEVLPYHNYGYPSSWQEILKQKEGMYHEQHPVPSVDQPTYLHKGLVENSHMAVLVNSNFSKNAPVRIL